MYSSIATLMFLSIHQSVLYLLMCCIHFKSYTKCYDHFVTNFYYDEQCPYWYKSKLISFTYVNIHIVLILSFY